MFRKFAAYVRQRTDGTGALRHDMRRCSFSSSSFGEHLNHLARNGKPVPGLFFARPAGFAPAVKA